MTLRARQTPGSAARRPLDRRGARAIIETALIEPNSLFREGMEHILAQTRLQVVVKAEAVASLPATSPGRKPPRLAILATEGADAPTAAGIGELKRKYPDCRVVCLIESDRSDASIFLLKSGAAGVLLRSIGADAFVRSLELVMLGEHVLPAAALSAACSAEARQATPAGRPLSEVDRPSKPDRVPNTYNLSVRELAILRCLVQGESNKVIAHNLDIAEATVKVHVKAILRKIQVQNRTQAAIWALHHLTDRDFAGSDEMPVSDGPGRAGPIPRPDGASLQLL